MDMRSVIAVFRSLAALYRKLNMDAEEIRRVEKRASDLENKLI
jgi:hypothetical protein